MATRIDTELLFYLDKWQLIKAFRKSCSEAKIDDFRLHDLRHTFASYQAMAGIQGRTLQALLGHKDMRMTGRYSHLSDAQLKQIEQALKRGPQALGYASGLWTASRVRELIEDQCGVSGATGCAPGHRAVTKETGPLAPRRPSRGWAGGACAAARDAPDN